MAGSTKTPCAHEARPVWGTWGLFGRDHATAAALRGRAHQVRSASFPTGGKVIMTRFDFVLRYRQITPDVARAALLATHGSLSLECYAVIYHIAPMALYRLIYALGQQRVVTVLTRCGLPLPTYFLADEKHSRCLTEKVSLPTIVRGRVIWHLGYTTEASAAAFTQSYGAFQRAASQPEPSYRV